ncbi:peroxidase family protein [Jiella avicenniae]|uniref:Animal haem peroxidase n=1 Tax=Jiella avicenniae TaxID=2907202 RepID=A0A9X1P1L3_9HYPH|nr:peroxidase family protein [Jiella avicenniae]MCE7028114.1 hypothetical protein [Jiella avicenniae]
MLLKFIAMGTLCVAGPAIGQTLQPQGPDTVVASRDDLARALIGLADAMGGETPENAEASGADAESPVDDVAISTEALNALSSGPIDAQARALIVTNLQAAGHGTSARLLSQALETMSETPESAIAKLVAGRFCRIICAEQSPLRRCRQEPLALPSAEVAGPAARNACDPHEIAEMDEWRPIFGANRSAEHMGSASALYGDGPDNPNIPSGYTFLGQFIDHDMTATLVALGQVENVVQTAVAMAGPQTAGEVNQRAGGAASLTDAAALLLSAAVAKSMDPTAESRGGSGELEISNGRSADLDLDSVYGPYSSYESIIDAVVNGEAFAVSGFERREGVPTGRFAFHVVRSPGGYDSPPSYDANGETTQPRLERAPLTGFDFPRASDLAATVIDPRNDENKVIAGIHTMFELMHNDCVDFYTQHQGRSTADAATRLTIPSAYNRCRLEVPMVYQTVLLTDYLPRTLDATFAGDLLGASSVNPQDNELPQAAGSISAQPVIDALRFYEVPPSHTTQIPESFAVAAFRLGHSQLRSGYALQRDTFNEQGDYIGGAGRKLFDAATGMSDLSGRQPMAPETVVDWSRFFQLGGEPLRSKAIDLKLPSEVAHMPVKALPPEPRPGEVPDVRTDTPSEQNLARRNILRAAAPTHRPAGPEGPEVDYGGVGLPPAEDYVAFLSLQLDGYDGEPVFTEVRDTLGVPEGHPIPLWLYVLGEAQNQNGGERLGTIGSVIVGETIAGIIAYDDQSVLNAPLPSEGPVWEPIATVRDEKRYSMPDVVRHLQAHVCLSEGGERMPVRLVSEPDAATATCS